MTFPMVPLPLNGELFINGQWTDATSDIRGSKRIELSRGRKNEQSKVSAGNCNLTINNASGKYSNRYPLSINYKKLGKNTPFRLGVLPMADNWNRVVADSWGTSSSGHLWTVISGQSTSFDVTGTAGTITHANTQLQTAVLPNYYGNVEMRVKIRMSDRTKKPTISLFTHTQDIFNAYKFDFDTFFVSDRIVIRKEKTGFLGNIAFKETSAVPGVALTQIPSNTDFWIAIKAGKRLKMKIWLDSNPEPIDWDLDIWQGEVQNNGTVPPQMLMPGKVGIGVITTTTGLTTTFEDLSVRSYRCVMEVPDWPPEWDSTGRDIYIPIQAAGILRRLGQNNKTVESPMNREALRSATVSDIAGYWSCEDIDGSSSVASGLVNGSPMQIFTTSAVVQPPASELVDFASDSSIPGSKPFTKFKSGGNFSAPLDPNIDTSQGFYNRITFDIPAAPSTPDQANIINFYMEGGNIARFKVIWGSAGVIKVQAEAPNKTIIDETGGITPTFSLKGSRIQLGFEFVQNGANVDFLLSFNRIVDSSNTTAVSSVFLDTLNGVTMGQGLRITGGGFGTMDDWGFCHLGSSNNQAFMFGMLEALIGNAGERAGIRAKRIAIENGIDLDVIGNPDISSPMGPQQPGTPLDLIYQCADADRGIVYETRDDLSLSILLFNAIPSFDYPELVYSIPEAHLSPPLKGTDDDQLLHNYVKTTRIGGTTYITQQETGPNNVNDPKINSDGVGVYDRGEIVLNLNIDDQLVNKGEFIKFIGTWDEQRYPMTKVNLARSTFVANQQLAAWVSSLDTGDLFAINSIKAKQSPDPAVCLVQGIDETITNDGDSRSWEFAINSTPGGPYLVGQYDTDESRYNPSVIVLQMDRDSDDTQWPCRIFPPARKHTELVTDDFNVNRTDQWGASDTGQLWTVHSTAADYDVTGGVGRIATVTINNLYYATVDSGAENHRVTHLVTVPVVPTGAGITLRTVVGSINLNSMYEAILTIDTAGVATLALGKWVGGVASGVPSTPSSAVVGTHAAGNTWGITIELEGQFIKAKAWNNTTSFDTGSLWSVTAFEKNHKIGFGRSRVGVGVRRETGNTNGTINIDFDNFICTGWTKPELPIDLMFEGERVRVTDINTVQPQLVGVGASVNDANLAGTSTLNPPIHASTQEFDLILLLASIRNSGTGTVNTPAGYSPLIVGSNFQIFAKYASTSESAPTVSFSNGVANATVLAQTATFRGVGNLVHFSSGIQLNASAQNIAFPAASTQNDYMTFIAAGWKQDDWTTADISDFAFGIWYLELGDITTTNGDDASMVWDYSFVERNVDLPAQSFTITGGAAAISKGFIIALAPIQVLTLARNINGMAKPHLAFENGTVFHATRYGI